MVVTVVTVVTVTRRGAEVPICPEVTAVVTRELVVTPFAPMDPWPKKYKVYAIEKESYVVPLHWAKATWPDARWVDTRGPGAPAHLVFHGELKADLGQVEAVSKVEASWAETGGALMCLGVGQGKTATALYLASRLKTKTLVVVHKTFLKDQWRSRVAQFLPGATVSEVQGDVCDTSGDIVLAMVQTLVSRKYAPSTFESIGLVVVDEAHHWAAKELSHTMLGLCAPYTLALTATPERKDRLERVVSWFLGALAVCIKRDKSAGTVVRHLTYSCPAYQAPPPFNRRGDVDYTGIVTALAENGDRTSTVCQAARDVVQEGHHVLVLSHRRDHCTAIASGLVALGVDAATYLGGDKTIPETRVIVATFSLTSEGFDCPRLSALVLATPSSNVEQACGRVMRGSARSAVIVDVVDSWGICFAQAAKRRSFYRKSGFTFDKAGPPAPPAPPAAPMGFAFLAD